MQFVEELKTLDPVGYEIFKKFHGNIVVYDPVRITPGVDMNFYRPAGSVFATAWPDTVPEKVRQVSLEEGTVIRVDLKVQP